MPGEWIRKSKNKAVVIFIHGLISNNEECWKSNNGSSWLHLLESEPSYNEFGIYTFSYKTSFTSGSYSIGDIVDELKEYIFNIDHLIHCDNIIFVCHSMGGIIARKLLVERSADFIEKNTKVGFFLVASPSLGSRYANWLEPIAKACGHEQAKALRFSQSNQWLNDLDRTFLNLKDSRKIHIYGKELVEDTFITLFSLKFTRYLTRKQIVEPFSGNRYFSEPIKIPGSCHISISKPENERSLQHRLLCSFLSDSVQKQPIQTKKMESIMGHNVFELCLEKRFEESLSSFSAQPKIFVEPIISRQSELSNAVDKNEKKILVNEIISSSESCIIQAPPQFGLTCLSHYLILEAWKKGSNSQWIYLDASTLTPHKSVIEKHIKSELKISNKNQDEIECIILDSWSGESEGSSQLLTKLCEIFPEKRIIIMHTMSDINQLGVPSCVNFDRPFKVYFLWSLPRDSIRKLVCEYNSVKQIGIEDSIVSRVISDLDILNIHRTPLNCLTLLKVLEIDFQESPINRAEVIQRVLFLLFNVDDIPSYKARPDLKDCEFVLGYFCEQLLKSNNFTFSYESFLSILKGYCKSRYIDLDIDVVFSILFENNIIIKCGEKCRFKFRYWIYYFLAQRMKHDNDFSSYILEDMRYAKFPEVIEFYTSIDRQREDAIRILLKDIRDASTQVKLKCGLPEDFNPFRTCRWQVTPQTLEQMQDEISNGVQESNLPESIKDSYADRDYDRAKPYNQEVIDIFNHYSYLIMIQVMIAGSRALRNSDYIDPNIKKELLDEIMKCWLEISKVLIVLSPILASEGYAAFEGQAFRLKGNFGETPLEKLHNILLCIPFNIVKFNKDDIYSQRMAPLLTNQLENEENDFKKHILALITIHQRPRGWHKLIENYIKKVKHDSFYLLDIHNCLRTQYKYSFANKNSLSEIEHLIKLSMAKHTTGVELPGEKYIKKVPSLVIPKRP